MRRAFILLILLSGLSGCASTPDPRLRDPTVAEWEAADFGSEPAYYDAAIRTYLEDVLKTPPASTLTVTGGPRKTWIGSAPDFQFGYGVCLDIVQRGAYTGYSDFGPTFVFLFNGKVIQLSEGADGERLCARLGRAPPGEKTN